MKVYLRWMLTFGWLAAMSTEVFAITLADIGQAISDASSFSSRFSMMKRTNSVGTPLMSEGRLVLVRNKGLLWAVTEPFEESVGFSEKKRGFTDDRGQWQVKENQTPGIVNEIMQKVLGGDFSFLSDRFFIEVDGSKNAWKVLATPKIGNAKEWIAEVLITGGGRHISRVQIVMKDQTVTEIVFTETKDNPEIDQKDRLRLESLQ